MPENSSTTDLDPLVKKKLALLAEACGEAKALQTAALCVSQVFNLADYFLITSGHSDRHVQGICNKIISILQEQGYKPLTVEGFEKAHWVLIDFDEVIIHIFYEPVRAHYNLEALWQDAQQVDLSKLEEDLRPAVA